MKFFYDLHLPMSRIIFPLGFIPPPPWIHFVPVSFCSSLEIVKWFAPYSRVPYHFSPVFILPPPPIILPPYYFAPWKLFNDLHYLPMSHILIFLPPGFILAPFTKKAYDRRASGDCGTSGCVYNWKQCSNRDLNALRILMNFWCIYLGKEREGGAVMHVYVWEHIVSLYYRNTWWMFTKLDRDEVLMTLHMH